MATPVLEMRNVEKNFGGVRAIDNFSVTLEPGKIHGLIGPNGAGKTTIFNNITGIYAPDSGKIIFNGTDITGSAPHRVAQLGIGRTFQNIRLFSNLSVLSNVVIASNLDATYNMADAIFKTKKYREREKHLEEKAQRQEEMAAQAAAQQAAMQGDMPGDGAAVPDDLAAAIDAQAQQDAMNAVSGQAEGLYTPQ